MAGDVHVDDDAVRSVLGGDSLCYGGIGGLPDDHESSVLEVGPQEEPHVGQIIDDQHTRPCRSTSLSDPRRRARRPRTRQAQAALHDQRDGCSGRCPFASQ